MQVETQWLKPQQPGRRVQQEPALLRWSLIAAAVAVISVLVIVPVVSILVQAFAKGWSVYWRSLADADTVHAIKLTLFVAPIAVIANVIFGIAAAWAVTRFRFPGRTLLTTIIDLPFAVSPVVAGLMITLLFSRRGYFGPWLLEHGIQILFSWPAIILATAFVTFPFVARELIPIMDALGSDEETAAVSLGASGWQMFWRVTVPNIKWGLLYGVILCSARAIGEFGAVYVVSGHIHGQTTTVPVRINQLYEDYNNAGAFTVASVLTLFALVTLGIKVVLERKTRQELEEAHSETT
ncbi:MAG: sulfate ABC transporter permease subunit CysW [Planctomycetia bacterium]|nr:sulfate ABC transporter permease subunit CysW [Planctomycetia bacterium]